MQIFLSSTFLLLVATTSAVERVSNIRGVARGDLKKKTARRDLKKKGWPGNGGGDNTKGKNFGVHCCKPHDGEETACGAWDTEENTSDACKKAMLVDSNGGCTWNDGDCDGTD
jgi:hypothetical protein